MDGVRPLPIIIAHIGVKVKEKGNENKVILHGYFGHFAVFVGGVVAHLLPLKV